MEEQNMAPGPQSGYSAPAAGPAKPQVEITAPAPGKSSKTLLIIIIAAVVIVLAGGAAAGYFFWWVPQNQEIVCAQDAKKCSDGSYVSRVAPDCEFADCPIVVDPTADWKTFKNVTYGIEIKYPEFFAYYKNISDVQSLSYIPVCEADSIFCLAYPKEEYGGTNFEGAGFSIGVEKNVGDEQKCAQFSTDSIEKDLNGYKAFSAKSGGAAAGHGSSDYIFRTFQNGYCYEIKERVTFSVFANYPEGTIEEFSSSDEQKIISDLDQVLAELKFTTPQNVLTSCTLDDQIRAEYLAKIKAYIGANLPTLDAAKYTRINSSYATQYEGINECAFMLDCCKSGDKAYIDMRTGEVLFYAEGK